MRLMISKVIRLLALCAVLLMPFGMTAPAVAAHHGSMAASMPMQHCPDDQQPDGGEGIAQCTMACAAALPDLSAPAAEHLMIVCAPPASIAPQALHGIHEDIATPPPKAS